jgi:hypothetical protein
MRKTTWAGKQFIYFAYNEKKISSHDDDNLMQLGKKNERISLLVEAHVRTITIIII